jgi:tetratricopeptide (TPR) repeat protein
MNAQIQITELVTQKAKPTYQEIEQALINVVKAGIYYRRPKDGKFMQSYKERIRKLRQAENPNEYILNLAQTIFPNKAKYEKVIYDYKQWYGNDPKILSSIMDLYKLYYELAKDNFISEEQVDKETKDFLSSI